MDVMSNDGEVVVKEEPVENGDSVMNHLNGKDIGYQKGAHGRAEISENGHSSTINQKENSLTSAYGDLECKIEELLEENDSSMGNESSNVDESKFSSSSLITKEMLEEEQQLEQKAIADEEKMRKEMLEREKKIEEEKCLKRLHLLLSRSSIYAKFMAEKLELHEKAQKKKESRKSDKNERQSGKHKAESSDLPPKKKAKYEVNFVNVLKNTNLADYSQNSEDNTNNISVNDTDSHPALFYGGRMRPYQIEGYEWLKTLYENGVNGILADEMGLGKTIQCIAFIAYLIEMGIPGPFFVCAPLSTLPNWYSEFKRFAPDIPVILYHGHKDHRVTLRKNITKKVKNDKVFCCPVVITSYQIALIDAKPFFKIDWKILVIDEAHRIKNFQCRLIKALKMYNSAHRLLLTGTPLQNNLDELWSLLNFILPEIFDDLQVFQSWFDIQALSQKNASLEIVAKEQEKKLISTIQQILTPFLLRRTKLDVQLDLPPKKEVVVQVPMTSLQKKYYTAVLNKSIAKLLKPVKSFDVESMQNLAKRKSKKTDYFGCEYDDIPTTSEPVPYDPNDLSFHELNLKLQNTQMVLRKITCHPYLILKPLKQADDDFIKASGKLLVLDLMLPELKKRGHKVIIFSQFVSMLTLLEDYCIYRKHKFSCLYGYMGLDARQEELEDFKDASTFIFLISTKAGGLGLNIISADTVIIFDSDWNPQNDLQAQDRCHRIGQTKPVVVYRLVIPNTIDQRILDFSSTKRKLEKAIIQKGRFNSKSIIETPKVLTKEELLELLEADYSGFVKTDENEILSPAELEKLLDRSDMK